jgi:acetate kinase
MTALRTPQSPDASESTSSGTILSINGGSSSVKFALFSSSADPVRLVSGRIERVGGGDGSLLVRRNGAARDERYPVDAKTPGQAAEGLANWLAARPDLDRVDAIGHRIVHGGVRLTRHQPITPDFLRELRENESLDLAHLPGEIALIEELGRKKPGVMQVACFDAAFHQDLPRVAQLLPIPRAYIDAGIRRLGFHGLSYGYLMGELRRVAGDAAADGRVILAHLGSGASMAAVRGGRPLDTTMAFTPAAGLVMGTRPGSLDPGLLAYLMQTENLSAEGLDELVNRRCGLRGVSDTTSDMEELLARRGNDVRAAEAVDLFCYEARKWIGAFTAVLGGLDTLVFSGGIGEHAAPIREAICEGLAFLGVRLDGASNARNAPAISAEESSVVVRVIPTDEEIMIARIVRQLTADS